MRRPLLTTGDAASAASVAQVETLGLSEAVLQLSASDYGHRTVWAGRVRGGAEVLLDGGWVRKNFSSAFVREVDGAHGQFVHIDTTRPRPEVAAQPGELGGADGAVLPAPLPSIAYRQYEATFCAAYGPASAVHWYGDADVAALVAAAARAVLSSPDQISFVRTTSSTWRLPAGGRSTS